MTIAFGAPGIEPRWSSSAKDGIDRRDDLGAPDRFNVYFGMADNRIGAARLDVPECLPPGGLTVRSTCSNALVLKCASYGLRVPGCP